MLRRNKYPGSVFRRIMHFSVPKLFFPWKVKDSFGIRFVVFPQYSSHLFFSSVVDTSVKNQFGDQHIFHIHVCLCGYTQSPLHIYTIALGPHLGENRGKRQWHFEICSYCYEKHEILSTKSTWIQNEIN